MDQTTLDKKTEKFREDLLNGSFKKDVSPNHGTRYHGELEKRDFEAFLEYLDSDLFKEINGLKEIEDTE